MLKTKGAFTPSSDHLQELCGKYARLRQDKWHATQYHRFLTVATISRQMEETKTDITRVVAMRLVALGVIRQADIHRLKVAYRAAHYSSPEQWNWELVYEAPRQPNNYGSSRGERV